MTVNITECDASDLKSVTAAPSALDNQWISQDLLDELTHPSTQKPFNEVRSRRDREARCEYLRSLVVCEQVVLNRAFIINSPAVSRDYKEDTDNTAVFKALLADATIVPYLYSESLPDEKPKYDHDADALVAWTRLCGETEMSCVRLSWDDKVNEQLIKQHLSQNFHQFCQAISAGDVDSWSEMFLSPLESKQFRKRLAALSTHCVQRSAEEELVTRNELYKEFVLSPKSPDVAKNPVYATDQEKPFAGWIKQLIDLRYNANLPDALDKFLMTPNDSLDRLALQELSKFERLETVDPSELARVVKAISFDVSQHGLEIPILSQMQLVDVGALRDTQEWLRYRDSMDDLISSSLRNPFAFADTGDEVFEAYAAVSRRASSILKSRLQSGYANAIRQSAPTVKVVFEVLGAFVEICFPGSGGKIIRATGKLSDLAGQFSPMTAKIIVEGDNSLDEGELSGELTLNAQFMRYKFDDIRSHDGGWEDFICMLEDGIGTKRADIHDSDEDQATLNTPV